MHGRGATDAKGDKTTGDVRGDVANPLESRTEPKKFLQKYPPEKNQRGGRCMRGCHFCDPPPICLGSGEL